MTWHLTNPLPPQELAALGRLTPVEVLYEFEGPCIFTAAMPSGSLALAYLSEDLETERLLRFIVAETTQAEVEALKAGTLPVAQALGRRPAWIVDLDYDRLPSRAFTIEEGQLPEDAAGAGHDAVCSVSSAVGAGGMTHRLTGGDAAPRVRRRPALSPPGISTRAHRVVHSRG
jgi:hypothetical protein